MKANKRARDEAKQLFRLCIVNGLLDENRARQTVQQIVATKPRGYLGTLEYFRRLVELDRAQHAATVESAVPLVPDLQSKVKTALTGLYGAGLRITFGDNPALIGGMRIKVGSDVYDGSVRARLAALEQSF
jgi:F-type H+-transporting ATPase subunit delta